MSKAIENFKTIEHLIPQPLLFYTVVLPKRARTLSEGGIILSQGSVDVEKMTTTVGQVAKLGTLAYKTKTPGLDYAEEYNAPKEGDWVLYQKSAAMKITFAIDKSKPVDDPDNRVDIVLLTDTDMLLKLTQKQVDSLVGWVQ